MSELAEVLIALEEERVYELVESRLRDGVPPLDIIAECNAGMVGIGERFSSGEYFLSELIFSAEILQNVMKRLDPLLAGEGETPASLGKIVIGTVKGDTHDIGKNIVASLLRGNGFEVVDLGVDVPAAGFVQAVQDTGARVLGLSALLNFTYPEMKNVVDTLRSAGLREKVTVIVGGAPCNEQVRQYTGADYYAADAITGVNICKGIYG